MTRDEVIHGIEEVDARVGALRSRLEANPETHLLTGEWRVRDALSHLAARANPVANVLGRLEISTASGASAPRVNIDEINHEQVEERSERNVIEILDELSAGHRTAIESLPPDDVLARSLPVFGGGELSVAEVIARSGARHEHNHLNDIEAALDA